MKPCLIISLLAVVSIVARAADALPVTSLYHADFTKAPGTEWHWGLGTWSTKDGVLRGFESGPRRHGPVKMQKLAFSDATFTFDVRLLGRAHWASVVFNDDGGHLFIVTLARSSQTLVVNKPADKKDPASKPVKIAEAPLKLTPNDWHHVSITLKAEQISVKVNDVSLTGQHAVIGKPKTQFGLSGDSGGPEGEKAGALEFRNLDITKPAGAEHRTKQEGAKRAVEGGKK
jgi:hypothetical protein